MTHDIDDLAGIFGTESSGDTPEDRAVTSLRKFVRSQDELALFNPNATGRVLSAWEAYHAFGLEALREVLRCGSAILVKSNSEPASTLRRRREELGLSKSDIASWLDLSKEDIENAEDQNTRNSFRLLERIAQAVALDAEKLTFVEGADGDEDLAIRLRKLGDESVNFDATTILLIDEAAWVIQEQTKLWSLATGDQTPKIGQYGFETDSRYGNYQYPPWQVGYDLARSARRLLGLDEVEPIKSLRSLIEETLCIPVVQMQLPKHLAGATIANGQNRGILVNVDGLNENVWVRRSTLAHELGHLLWDPDERLQSVLVDGYEELNEPWLTSDQVEARANAFAIEFLAPQAGILEHFDQDGDRAENMRRVMEHFGISFTSAKYQIWNTYERKIELNEFVVDDVRPSDEWIGSEEFALDFFKPESVPPSRRGLFAPIVVMAEKNGFISSDTASVCLNCDEKEYLENRDLILEIYGMC